MKKNKVLSIGIAVFTVFILISTTTAVQVKNKEAVDTVLDKKDETKNIIEQALTKDFDTSGIEDVDIKSLLLTLYNDQEFIDEFNQLKIDIQTKINDTFSQDKKSLLEQFFNIDETFDLGSLYNRIQNTNYNSPQLEVDIQDKFELADDLNELETNYEGKAKQLLDILYRGDGEPNPESSGLHDTADYICHRIANTYINLISILDPILGWVGIVTAVVSYVIVLAILLFPLIIPMTLTEAALDTIEYEPIVLSELEDLYNDKGIDGLIAYGWIIVLRHMIQDGYLKQAIKDIGKVLILREITKDEENITYDTGQSMPKLKPLPSPKDKHSSPNYDIIFNAIIEDNDMVDGNYRDKVQAGWDWNDDDIVDEWTELSYARSFEFEHTFHEQGYITIKSTSKDQWGCMGEWSEPKEILVDKRPNKPSITGPTSPNRAESVTYTALTEDPEEDEIYYQWKVDNLVVEINGKTWFGPYNSGEPDSITKTQGFVNSGDHKVEVRAKDSYGKSSDWATLQISIEKTKSKTFSIFDHLNIERFPILAYIIKMVKRV